jgi:hypothetical protein
VVNSIIIASFFSKKWLFKYEKKSTTGYIYTECYNSLGETIISDGKSNFGDESVISIATKSDIESIFAKVFEKMGFKEGVKVISSQNYNIYTICNNNVGFDIYNNMVIIGYVSCYFNGKFATIVKEEPKYTVEEIASKLPMINQEFIKEQFKA